MPKALNVPKGTRFNRLEVIKEVNPDRISGRNVRRFKCKCDCGHIGSYLLLNMRCGDTQSCGCLNIDSKTIHGLKKHPLYDVWKGMIRRCYDKNCKKYKYYGGRGIKVCKDWRNSPEGLQVFVSWAENNGFKPGLEIDRRDNNKSYKPSNCRFVTRLQNILNRSNTIIITKGKYKGRSLREVWLETNCSINYKTVVGRFINKGWTLKDSLNKPSCNL